MRAREYYELARRSLKIRKKSNRGVVVGLSLGIALLVPLIVALFGVNVSLTSQLNETPYLIYFRTSITDYRVETEDGERQISGSKHIDFITNPRSVQRKIIYESYNLQESIGHDDNTETAKISIDGGEFMPTRPREYVDKPYLSIVDLDKSDSIFPENLTKHYKGGIFVDGCGGGFVGDGKKQVVISEKYLADNNLKPVDVYNKPITVTSKGKAYFGVGESDFIETEAYICKNYTVVGIIKSEISDLYGYLDFMNSAMFFTSVNLYDSAGVALKPKNVKTDKFVYSVYENLDIKDTMNEKYMMPGQFGSKNFIYKDFNNQTFASTCIYGESDTFQKTNSQMTALTKHFKKAIGDGYTEYLSSTDLFDRYIKVYNVTNIISFILIIVGVVLGFTSILNMFSSILHSVKQRKYYLTLMRAIGAKDSAIPKLYMTESAILCGRASIVIAVVGFALSAGIKVIVDKVLTVNGISYNLSIPWWTIFVTLIASIAVVFALGLSFSYVVTSRLKNKKISEVLNSQ